MRQINIPVLLEAFFNERMIGQLRASNHTLASYSDTFRLLLQYAGKQLKKKPFQLALNDLNAQFLSQFLADMEKVRKICTRTRNARLAAIRSFFHYLSFQFPVHGKLINEVLAIPEKRRSQKLIDFLTLKETNALVNAPNQKTWVGKRDNTFLVVAIHTGMRLAELTALRWKDVHLEQGAYIECLGKGRKARLTPLSQEAIKCLSLWIKELNPLTTDVVFPTIHGEKMSPDAVEYMVKKYTAIAAKHCHSLTSKKITPHVLRHTAAMRLVQTGIDLSSIALWLGHESIKTTYVYMTADIAMKEKIIKNLPVLKTKTARYKTNDKTMAFLEGLANLRRNKNEKTAN